MQLLLGRLGAYILNQIIKKAFIAIYAYTKTMLERLKRKKIQEKAQEQFNEVVQSEQSTKEERVDAYANVINNSPKP